jgi:hypothetical protein
MIAAGDYDAALASLDQSTFRRLNAFDRLKDIGNPSRMRPTLSTSDSLG